MNEQTTYAVEGYFPVLVGGDPLATAKSDIAQALIDARNNAREKGVQVVKARTFFPGAGYKIRLDIGQRHHQPGVQPLPPDPAAGRRGGRDDAEELNATRYRSNRTGGRSTAPGVRCASPLTPLSTRNSKSCTPSTATAATYPSPGAQFATDQPATVSGGPTTRVGRLGSMSTTQRSRSRVPQPIPFNTASLHVHPRKNPAAQVHGQTAVLLHLGLGEEPLDQGVLGADLADRFDVHPDRPLADREHGQPAGVADVELECPRPEGPACRPA